MCQRVISLDERIEIRINGIMEETECGQLLSPLSLWSQCFDNIEVSGNFLELHLMKHVSRRLCGVERLKYI